jgi:hypothetical protein
MNFFGLTISQAELWVIGGCGTILTAWITIRVSESVRLQSAATVAYRHAFDDAILNITENPECTIAMIAQGCHNGILAAISNYRSAVPFWRHRAFVRAVANYKEAYDVVTESNSPFALGLSETTDIARLRRKHYHNAIKLLLSFV